MEKVIDENNPNEIEIKVGDYVYAEHDDGRIYHKGKIVRTTKTMAVDNRGNKFHIVAKSSNWYAKAFRYEVVKKGGFDPFALSYFLENEELKQKYKIELMKSKIRMFDWASVNNIEILTKVVDIINSIKND